MGPNRRERYERYSIVNLSEFWVSHSLLIFEPYPISIPFIILDKLNDDTTLLEALRGA
jgi:hypothetical protein